LTRASARRRRIAARAAWFAPAVIVLVWDLAHRGASYVAMLHADGVALLVTWALSATAWTCAIVASARRRGAARWIARALLALLGALAALQGAAFEYFAVTIDFPLLQSAWRLEGMASLVRPFLGTIARWTSFGALLAVAWSVVVARLAKTTPRAARRAFVGALVALVVASVVTAYLPHVSTDAAPDVLALGAVGRLAIDRPHRFHASSFVAIPDVDFPRTVPPIPPAQPRVRRNVLFVLTESVRASSYCSAYDPHCAYNTFTNDLLRDRLPIERMRSVDSFTLLSFGVIFTGLAVTAPRADWLTAPLLFDYAHAAGISTAYWSAHHADFANSHDWTDHEPMDRLAWASDLDPHAGKLLGADDALVVDRALADLATLREPFFAVVHFSGTHFPYQVDSDAPFLPIGTSLDRRDPAPLRNRYLDAIHRQDELTATLVRAVRAMPLGARTVIVFTSDHGESFYEHDSVLHGSSLWDTELRVPAWIDAPPKLLSSSEIDSLRAVRDQPVTHEDIAPTILDLLGVWRVDAWKEFSARMVGESLLRSPARDRPMDIATCNDLWSCFVSSSGKLVGDYKWVTRPPEPHRCFDTRADPEERRDIGAKACGQP